MKWFAAILLCMVMSGCGPPAPEPAFRKGQFIYLRIDGRRGQIVNRWRGDGGAHYNVRIESGKLLVDLNEFELTIIKE